MTAFTATFSTEYSQCSRKWVDRMRPTISSGRCRVCASMAATRSSVGSTIGSMSVQWLSRNSRWRWSSVSGLDEAGRGAVELRRPQLVVGERAGEAVDDLLHDRPAGDGVAAVDVGAQLGRRLAHDRLGDEHLAQPRHAVDLGHRADDPVELVGVDGHGGDPVLRLERHRVRGDRRRAGTSVADAEDGRVAPRLDLLPRGGVVVQVDVRDALDDRPHAGQVLARTTPASDPGRRRSRRTGSRPGRPSCPRACRGAGPAAGG